MSKYKGILQKHRLNDGLFVALLTPESVTQATSTFAYRATGLIRSQPATHNACMDAYMNV